VRLRDVDAFAFSNGSCTVCLTPSKLKPIMSFLVLKFPSPAANFFAEIGSLPPSWLVTEVGGDAPGLWPSQATVATGRLALLYATRFQSESAALTGLG